MYRTTCFIAALVAASAFAAPSRAAPGPPLASAWNIAVTGDATSSGDLDFRITRGDGSDPVDITVAVISGARQDSVVRSIQRALSSQSRRDHYKVELGENGNVLISDSRGEPNFSLELVDATIEGVRVAVQNVSPAAPPTAPMPSVPADAPPASRPDNAAPGNAAPPPANSAPLPNPNPPNTSEAAGAPSSAPPPR